MFYLNLFFMKKLKLNRLSDQTLAEKQMNSLKGGTSDNPCPTGYCGCNGPSSTSDNYKANISQAKHSPYPATTER
jgi:natural product precursor